MYLKQRFTSAQGRDAITALAVLLLATVVILQFAYRRTSARRLLPDLAAALPSAPAGWAMREEPLGPTEALTAVDPRGSG
ncbi:MAG: hypothetical protein RIR76_1404 [Verrucomicrobiota bacterium]|jgi:hypothetical protein